MDLLDAITASPTQAAHQLASIGDTASGAVEGEALAWQTSALPGAPGAAQAIFLRVWSRRVPGAAQGVFAEGMYRCVEDAIAALANNPTLAAVTTWIRPDRWEALA